MKFNRLPNALLITSGKGGVGKTWFSVNLAHALINQQKKVLFFDGDLGLSNVDIQLGLDIQWDLKSVLNKACTFEQAILPYKPHDNFHSHLDIITGRTIDGVFTTVSKAGVIQLRDSLTEVSQNYDHMILDLSAGLDQIIVEFSTFAQGCIVVITNEPTSLSDSFDFIKVSSQRNPDLPLQIVVNKVDSYEQGVEIYTKLVQACEHFLKTIPPLVGVIHHDPCVGKSIEQKTPTLACHPTSQVARDIEDIATKLISISQSDKSSRKKNPSAIRNYPE
jgi:flagellar biosynthesis protein FlhG